ncbi:hypothetical protein EYD10_01276 [Varanus komodoensis]|nr:hypothetical protein EYD10_01276 [Varanus komodoensis]
MELFRVVQGLVHPEPKKDPVPPSTAHCDDFAKHFKEKIAQIRHKLDSTSDSEPSGEVPMLLSGPKLMDEFPLLRPDNVDKVLGKVLERVVAGQLQALLDETDYLDPFQSGFIPGYGTESALVALYDDLCRERDGEYVPVGPPGPLSGFRYHRPWDKVCSLGVLLDPELSLEAQVTAVARSAFLQLQLIHQQHPYLENDCLVTVTHALRAPEGDNLILVGGTAEKILFLVDSLPSFLGGGCSKEIFAVDCLAPSPTSAVPYVAVKCIDVRKNHHRTNWFMPWGPNQCEKIRDLDEAMSRQIEANDIVFSIHMPLPNKEMSPWFQFMLYVLHMDIAFKTDNQIKENAEVTLDVSLAYRDDRFSEWKEMARAVETRKLKCSFGAPKVSSVFNSFRRIKEKKKIIHLTIEHEGKFYDCEVLPFMEIGTVAHKFYLINVRLPVNERQGINVGIGEIKDIRLVGIHQNGGFTKVWFAMKTFLTPSIFIIMIWYWRRITMLTRPPVLLEKVIFALGISMTFINIPVEWFSIGFDWTWMLLFGDIRQGIFYAMLLSFWIIFCGEHMMDQNERNHFSAYWKQVGPIAVGAFCLFIFDMCESLAREMVEHHSVSGVALPLKDKVRSLGVLLYPELSLEAQVTAVVRSAFFQLRLIHQLHPYLENDCLATVTHALVTSRLDFCNALYMGLPLKTVRILQLVQNRQGLGIVLT